MPLDQSGASITQGKALGLALSGGGFRATLFHLGVVRLLHEAELLREVTHICSVSGGSIFAAHLVLNWDRYTGSDESFEDAAQEVVLFSQRDVRGRVLRRWFFSFIALGFPRLFSDFRRSALLEKELTRLYKDATLAELKRPLTNGSPGSKRPELHILSTSMSNGQSASFGPSLFMLRDDENATEQIDIETLKVSLAVTASAAFPPAFPPVRVDHETLNVSRTTFQNLFKSRAQYLTDGGVFDNLGIRKLRWLEEENRFNFELIFLSDAQREFEGDAEQSYRFIVKRATRSTDLLMNRIAWFENSAFRKEDNSSKQRTISFLLKTRLGSNVTYSLNTQQQSRVHQTRTDLDAFTDDEVNALIHHGYAVARSSIERDFRVVRTSGPWVPLKTKATDSLNLGDTGKRKKNLFSFRDSASWATFAVLLFYLLVFAGAYKAKVTRDYRLKQEQDIAFNALSVTDALANLASHDQFQPQETQEDLRNWNNTKAKVASDDFFKNLFAKDNLGPEIDAAIQKWSNGERNLTLRNRAVALGRNVGMALRDLNNDSYNSWLTNKRDEWFKAIEYETIEIAKAEKFDDVMNGSVKRFWRLYLGDLCLVEGKEVATAMGRFSVFIEMWEQNKEEKPDFSHAFLQLSDALNTERDSNITSVER